MKKQEFIDQALVGKPLIVIEYRAFEAEEIRRKVPKAGESATMPMIKHKVLVGNDSFEIAEFLPDNAKVADYKTTYRNRDLLVFEVETMEVTKYGSRMSGKFHGKLE